MKPPLACYFQWAGQRTAFEFNQAQGDMNVTRIGGYSQQSIVPNNDDLGPDKDVEYVHYV